MIYKHPMAPDTHGIDYHLKYHTYKSTIKDLITVKAPLKYVEDGKDRPSLLSPV